MRAIYILHVLKNYLEQRNHPYSIFDTLRKCEPVVYYVLTHLSLYFTVDESDKVKTLRNIRMASMYFYIPPILIFGQINYRFPVFRKVNSATWRFRSIVDSWLKKCWFCSVQFMSQNVPLLSLDLNNFCSKDHWVLKKVFFDILFRALTY